MFDYQTSKHAHFDAACRAFALSHNLEDVAAAVGMRPQILRNKLNPVQPHRLTCDELLAIPAFHSPSWGARFIKPSLMRIRLSFH